MRLTVTVGRSRTRGVATTGAGGEEEEALADGDAQKTP